MKDKALERKLKLERVEVCLNCQLLASLTQHHNVKIMNTSQILAICGMLSPIVYTVMWILGGMLQSD
jgi:hypothetical protein